MRNKDSSARARGILRSLCVLWLSAAGSVVADAATNAIPWRVPNYTLTAREMDVRNALETFGVAEGVPVIMTRAVKGAFSGVFADMPAAEFLDRLATVNNLSWYYDGAAIHVSGAGEMLSTLIDLRYMKAAEVRSMLSELGVEDARFPIKTASDDELLMVSGPPRYVQLVSDMIAKADSLREQRTFNEIVTRVFPLKHTWADNVSFRVSTAESQLQITGVARLLEELMSQAGGTARESSGTNGMEVADDKLRDRLGAGFQPVIRPENRLNAVVVRDSATRMPMYERLISDLDRPQRLVEIGITVVEMNKNDALDWQLSVKATANRDKWSGGAGNNSANLFDENSFNSKGFEGSVTYLGDHVHVMASLVALKTKNKTRSISRTSLVTLDNLAAELSDEQSYHARMVGEKVADMETVTAGTRLQLKPRVLPAASTNEANLIWVSLVMKDGGFEPITVDGMPMDRTATLTTQAAIFEGEAILLAGYMRDVDEDAGWGIPYLRDIPWIGWLFGGLSTTKQTVQRMFILTPHVIDIDVENLARTQAVLHRDIVEVEQVVDALESSDEVRAKREKNREGDRKVQEDALERELKRIDEKNKRRLEAAKARAEEELRAEEKTKEEAAGAAH